MRVRRFLVAATAAFLAVAPARADQLLPQGAIKDGSGDVMFGALKLGRRQAGKLTLTPDAIETKGGLTCVAGAVCDVSGMSVTRASSVDTLTSLLSTAPVPFSHYGAGGTAGVDATAAFVAMQADTSSPTVSLPPGTYDITCNRGKPYFTSSVKLVGAGRGLTRIRVTSTSCSPGDAVLAWAGVGGVLLKDLTLNINGALPPTTGNASALVFGKVDGVTLDNIEVVGMPASPALGSGWIDAYVLGSTRGRVRNSRFSHSACDRGIVGFLLDNSYYGVSSGNLGSLSGTTMTVTTFGGNGSPQGIYPGLHIVGKGVPLGAYVVRQLSGTTGQAGTYQLSLPGAVPAGTVLNGVANDDWVIESSRFENTILSFQATNAVSSGNVIGPWCSGGGIIADHLSPGLISRGDTIRDGNRQPDGSLLPDFAALYDAAFEIHADDVRISNPTVVNVANVCVGSTGDRLSLSGGVCAKFAQAATNDATFVGSTSGATLTVASTSAGRVTAGQFLHGASGDALIQTDNGNGTFALDRSVISTTNATLTTTANIPNAAVQLAQAGGDGTSAGTSFNGFAIQGSGTAGEKYGYTDQDSTTGVGASILNPSVTGVSVAPFKIPGKTVVVAPGVNLTVGQLGGVAPNKGTTLGVTDAANPTYGGPLSPGGSVPALAVGTGTAFVAH